MGRKGSPHSGSPANFAVYTAMPPIRRGRFSERGGKPALFKDDSVEEITTERAAELLADRRARGPAKKAAKKGAKKAPAKKSAAKKSTAKKSATKKSAAKKTTKKAAAKKS